MARPKRFELLTPRFVIWLSRSQDLRSNVQKRLAFPSKESVCVVSAAEWSCADDPSPRRPLDPGLASVTGQDWPGLVREKGRSMSIKLTDTQLVMLSAAAQREDRRLTPPENLKGGAVHKVAAKLIAAGLVKEIQAKVGTPVWRRDEQTGQPYALKLTAAGAKAIAVDPADDVKPVGDERPGMEVDRSSTVAQPDLAAAGAFAAPSAQALASPRAPRVGTKLAEAVEMLRATEGATIAELSEAFGWLPHTTRAVLTGLRKRGYALSLERSDAGRGSAYRIAADANAARAGTAPIVIEPPSSARVDGASDPSASAVRPASATASRRSGSTKTSRAA